MCGWPVGVSGGLSRARYRGRMPLIAVPGAGPPCRGSPAGARAPGGLWGCRNIAALPWILRYCGTSLSGRGCQGLLVLAPGSWCSALDAGVVGASPRVAGGAGGGVAEAGADVVDDEVVAGALLAVVVVVVLAEPAGEDDAVALGQ